MIRGLLYIAFGDEYQELAVHTIRHARRHTSLPIAVLINGAVNPKWKTIDNLTIQRFEEPQSKNRLIKTQMYRYTPFDQTLYLDCDSVIRKPGVEMVFELSGVCDILLNKLLRWELGDKILRLYKNAMLNAEIELPLDVYNGGFICWRQSYTVVRFFNLWNHLWVKNGAGREMPALACALKMSEPNLYCVEHHVDHIFCPDSYDPDCLIQHNYNSDKRTKMDFFDEFKLPKIKTEWKPFDKNPHDWNWVEMP